MKTDLLYFRFSRRANICNRPESSGIYHSIRIIPLQEQSVLQYRLDEANTDFAVNTIAGIVTGDDDILLDSDIAEYEVEDLEEHLRILADVQQSKGCV